VDVGHGLDLGDHHRGQGGSDDRGQVVEQGRSATGAATVTAADVTIVKWSAGAAA
jgi:hypothetical protein